MPLHSGLSHCEAVLIDYSVDLALRDALLSPNTTVIQKTCSKVGGHVDIATSDWLSTIPGSLVRAYRARLAGLFCAIQTLYGNSESVNIAPGDS